MWRGFMLTDGIVEQFGWRHVYGAWTWEVTKSGELVFRRTTVTTVQLQDYGDGERCAARDPNDQMSEAS